MQCFSFLSPRRPMRDGLPNFQVQNREIWRSAYSGQSFRVHLNLVGSRRDKGY